MDTSSTLAAHSKRTSAEFDDRRPFIVDAARRALEAEAGGGLFGEGERAAARR